MIEVKFHKGSDKVCEVSLETFVEMTKEQGKYVKYGKDGKEAYAICPLCENPVRLLGIYARLKKQRPHARHCKQDIPGLAEFKEEEYLHCPYHRERADYITEVRKPGDITELNKEVLELAHDHFNECIYILRKITGLVISDALAEQIALDYMSHPGYMTYDVTKENVPYIMGRCMTGKTLVKRLVEENSPLYEMLKGKKEISLVPQPSKSGYKKVRPLYRVESKVGYLDILFNISQYRFSSTPVSGMKEYLKLHIGIGDGRGTYKSYAEKEIEVDPFLFNKLIHSTKKSVSKPVLLDIADRILVL